MSNNTDCLALSVTERMQLHSTIAFFCVLLGIVGIPGNCLIIHVYTKRINIAIFGFFIKTLAVLDLINSVGITPAFLLSKIITSGNLSLVCKTLTWYRYFYTCTTGTLYLLIAVQRFKKICRPHGPQLEAPLAKKLTYFSISFCFVSGLPVFFILTDNLLRVEWKVNNGTCVVSALTCDYTETAKQTKMSLLFSGWMVLFVLCIFVSLTLLYSTIVLHLRKHNGQISVSSPGRGKRSSVSLTVFFSLTAIYLLSVIPRLIQSVYFSQTPEFHQLTFTQLQMSDVAVHLPNLNCVANLFIYSFSYKRFRRATLSVLGNRSDPDPALTTDTPTEDRYTTHTTTV